jgi:NTE family protein
MSVSQPPVALAATAPLLADVFMAIGELRLVNGGDSLVEAQAPSDELYLLISGRIAAFSPDAPTQVGRVHRPGAIIGGPEFLSDERHTATLSAMRDSEVRVLSRAVLETLLYDRPELLAELARLSLSRLKDREAASARKASILGFIAVCDSVAMRDVAERLAQRMRGLGKSVIVLGADDAAPAAALSDLERRFDYILMAAERPDLDFTHYCGRQIDRLVLVGSTHSPLPDGPLAFAAAAIRRHGLIDLILIHPTATALPMSAERWLAAAPIARLFHMRVDDHADLNRLARTFTGRSIGLALSGGGARAYAHIGALRALSELGVAFDFLAGTSMGAVIAAGVAMGWDHDELDKRIRDAFVSSSPISDIAFPLLAMSRGSEVDRRLETHFAETSISDLWRPFTCVSTDLTTGDRCAHRSGRLRDALRASISLPGILPPVILDGHVHVDGALVCNLPADVLREQHDGPTLGINVAQTSGLFPEELMLRPAGWRWLTSGAWLKGPPIVSVLIRSATLPAAASNIGQSHVADLTITPDLGDVQLRDWKCYGPAVAAGYKATMEQAESLLRICA